ncbi:hypothetical protein ISS07_05445 [Candidatus Woesearchaeota archaeon]|nr:hypothetical protein [Candidatus Woesearchaeota archaeon]
MGMCKKCSKISGMMTLLVGILFLLKDQGIWDFWGLSWYTVLFLLVGVIKLASVHCGACQACCAPAPKGKKK